MNEWKPICRVDDIPVLGSRRVARPEGMPVAVFRNDQDQVFALLDRCPHKGGPLSQGIVFGTSVACPLHNWTIGLDSGCAKEPAPPLRAGVPAARVTPRQPKANDRRATRAGSINSSIQRPGIGRGG